MKIAIAGGAPSSEKLAPFGDESWEIWVLGGRFHSYPRFNRVFEIHDCEKRPTEEQIAKLISLGKPIIVGKTFPDSPNTVRFPFDEAKALIDEEDDYLTSSAAYMMAYAILEIRQKGDKKNEIGIYGMDMAVDDKEYFHQQPCMNAWIGLAKGIGIKVTIPRESCLFKSTHLYGVDYPKKEGPFSSDDFEELKNQHLGVVDVLNQEISERQEKILLHTGCAEVYNRLSKVARAVEGGQSIQRLRDTAIIKK